jgi:hypothetical protein
MLTIGVFWMIMLILRVVISLTELGSIFLNFVLSIAGAERKAAIADSSKER